MSLYMMNIRATNITEISGLWLRHLWNLQYFDIRVMPIKLFVESATKMLNATASIRSSDVRLCCILPHVDICQIPKQQIVLCVRILPQAYIGPVLLSLSIIAFVFCLASFRLNIVSLYFKKPFQCIILSIHIVGNVLCSIYFLIISTADILYGPYYTLNAQTWVDSARCGISSVFIAVGIVSSVFPGAVFTHLILTTLRRIVPPGKRYFVSAISILVVKILVMTIVFSISSYHRTCNANNGIDALCSYITSEISPNTWDLFPTVITMTLLIAIYLHILVLNLIMFVQVRSHGKTMSKLSPSNFNIHRQRSIKQLRNVLSTVIVKACACLPCPLLWITHISGYGISEDVVLAILVLTTFAGCYWDTIVHLWLPVMKIKSRNSN